MTPIFKDHYALLNDLLSWGFTLEEARDFAIVMSKFPIVNKTNIIPVKTRLINKIQETLTLN